LAEKEGKKEGGKWGGEKKKTKDMGLPRTGGVSTAEIGVVIISQWYITLVVDLALKETGWRGEGEKGEEGKRGEGSFVEVRIPVYKRLIPALIDSPSFDMSSAGKRGGGRGGGGG